MLVFRRSPFYGLCMVVGALLVGIAGLYHPVLTGDGAAQLGTIAGTAAWRTIHWALAFGLPFLYAGLVGVALRHSETPAGNQARAGVLIAGFGFALWAINILFMVGAGTALARAYQIADPGLTATRAVFLYDMVHPFGLAAERLATFTLGLALYLYGWTVSNGRAWPRWLGWAGIGGGGACMVVAVVVPETAVYLYYGQGLVVAWCAVAGVLMIAETRRV